MPAWTALSSVTTERPRMNRGGVATRICGARKYWTVWCSQRCSGGTMPPVVYSMGTGSVQLKRSWDVLRATERLPVPSLDVMKRK